MLVYISYNKTN